MYISYPANNPDGSKFLPMSLQKDDMPFGSGVDVQDNIAMKVLKGLGAFPSVGAFPRLAGLGGLGDSLNVDGVIAQMQAKVGEFLSMKNVLIQLQNVPNLGTADTVTISELYAEQLDLENQLNTNMQYINDIKAGNTSAFDLVSQATSIASFALQMEIHNDSVRVLANKYKVNVSGSGTLFAGLNLSSILQYGGLALLGYVAYKQFYK